MAALLVLAATFGVTRWIGDISPATGPGDRVFNHAPLIWCYTGYGGHYMCDDENGFTLDFTEICAAYPATDECGRVP